MSFTLPFYRTSVFVSSLQDLESNKKIINVLIQNQPLVQNLQMIRMINYSKHKKKW